MRARIALLLTVLLVPDVVRPIAAVPATVEAEVVRANALWEPQTGVHDRDLYDGPWGARLKPDPTAVYTFVRRKHTRHESWRHRQGSAGSRVARQAVATKRQPRGRAG